MLSEAKSQKSLSNTLQLKMLVWNTVTFSILNKIEVKSPKARTCGVFDGLKLALAPDYRPVPGCILPFHASALETIFRTDTMTFESALADSTNFESKIFGKNCVHTK
jgi:hypothetical protein